MFFRDIEGKEKRDNNRSFFNLKEAEVAVKYVNDFLKNSKGVTLSIGIITPYRG